MLRSVTIVVGFATLAFHTSLRAGVMAYAVAGTSANLYSVDLSTATATLIGSTGEFLEGLALSPGGTLFGTDTVGDLYTLNKTTGAATLVGNTGLGDVEGLVFDGSTLLGTNFASPTTIYSINTTNASAIYVVSANIIVNAMTLLDSNDVFVTSDSCGIPPCSSDTILSTINLTTGGVTEIGPLNDDDQLTAALAYNGVLYGLDSAGNEYIINQTNAGLTLVGNAGDHFYLDATVATPVPEPTSILLLFSGTGALGMKRLHRKLF